MDGTKVNNKTYLTIIPILVALILLSGVFYFHPYSSSKKVSVPLRVSKSQAENTVKSLPEVKSMLTDRGTEWIVEASDKNKAWNVHVAQIVKDSDTLSHMATFNWYTVDKKTGKVVCSMFTYDKNGKFTDKVDSCK